VLALYDQVLEIQPSNLDVLLAKSYVFYNQNQFSEYEALLKQVIDKDPNNVEALNGLGYYYVEANKNLDKAQAFLEKAVQLAPNNYFVMDSLGWLHFQRGEYVKAVNILEQAFDLGKDEEVFAHLVLAYLKNDQSAQAKALWSNYSQRFADSEAVQTLRKGLPAGFIK